MNSDTVLRLLNTAIHRGKFIEGKESTNMPIDQLEVIKQHILTQDEDLVNLRDDVTDLTLPPE